MGAPAAGFTSPEFFDRKLTFAAYLRRFIPMLVVLYLVTVLLLGTLLGLLGAGPLVRPLALVLAAGAGLLLVVLKKRQFDATWGTARLELSPAGATMVSRHVQLHLPWQHARLGKVHLAGGDGPAGVTYVPGLIGKLIAFGVVRASLGTRQPALLGSGTVTVAQGVPAYVRAQIRRNTGWGNARTSRGATAIVLTVYGRDWRSGRIGEWIRVYRPDLLAGDRRFAAPVPQPAASTPQAPPSPGPSGGAEDTRPPEHPVFRLRTGLDRATVLGRLGKPSRSVTSEELPANQPHVAGNTHRSANREFWLYENSLPDHDINVVLAGGVLETTEITRCGPDASGGTGSGRGRILIARDGFHASTPGHAYLALTAILRDTPAINSTQLQAAYEELRQSWHGAPGKAGPALAVSRLLLDDLTGDAAAPGHGDFMLVPMPDQACVQVVSIINQPGQPSGPGIAYRVWRTDRGQWALVRSKPRN